MTKRASKTRVANRLKKMAKGGVKKAASKKQGPRGKVPKGLTGTAKLCTAEWRESENENKTLYSIIQGVIITPKGHKSKKVTAMVFLTGDTDEKRMKKVNAILGDLQCLGIDTEGMDETDIAGAFDKLLKKKPVFKWESWSFRDSDDVNFSITGLAEDEDDDDDDGEAVDDDDDDQDDSDEDSDEDEDSDDDSDDDDSDDEEDEDSDDSDDEEDEDSDDSDDSDDEESDEEDEEDWEPAKGDQYKYKAPKARGRKLVNVVSVNKRAKTVNLEAVKGSGKWAKVSWDALEDAE